MAAQRLAPAAQSRQLPSSDILLSALVRAHRDDDSTDSSGPESREPAEIYRASPPASQEPRRGALRAKPSSQWQCFGHVMSGKRAGCSGAWTGLPLSCFSCGATGSAGTAVQESPSYATAFASTSLRWGCAVLPVDSGSECEGDGDGDRDEQLALNPLGAEPETVGSVASTSTPSDVARASDTFSDPSW